MHSIAAPARSRASHRQDAMTSAQTMQPGSRLETLWRALRAAALLAALPLTSCDLGPQLRPPMPLRSPYEAPLVWAVAPFANESGVSIVQGDRVADAFAEQIESVDGLRSVPVNRVIAAMRQLDLKRIASPSDAMKLMQTLNVHGVIVGTVTAYDSYDPPKFGAAIQLFQRDGLHHGGCGGMIDPIAATRAPSERPLSVDSSRQEPATAQASGVFDAANHQTLVWLDDYAVGRTEPNSAFGRREHLVRMDLYTQFVAYRLLHDLLASERVRLMPAPATQPSVGSTVAMEGDDRTLKLGSPVANHRDWGPADRDLQRSTPHR